MLILELYKWCYTVIGVVDNYRKGAKVKAGQDRMKVEK